MAIQSLEQRKQKSVAYTGEGNPNWGKKGRRNRKSRAIVQLTLQGEIVAHFDSYYEASKQYGTGVAKAVLGQTNNNYSNGFTWYYMKDFTLLMLFKHFWAKLFRKTTNVVKKKEHKVLKETPQKLRRNTYVGFKVDQYTYDGKFIRRWDSSIEVTKELGIPSASISRNIHKHTPHAGGYIFKRVEEDDDDE